MSGRAARSPRLVSLALSLTTAALAGAGAADARPPLAHWLASDARTRTARLLLVSSYDATNNGFNFDGYARGRMLVRVPRGWRLTIVCRNGGQRYHSCGVVAGPGATRLAFAGAATPDAVRGLAPGRSASFTFRTSRLGVYRLTCLVPGHERAREYAVLQIVRSGRPAVELLSPSRG